MMRRACLALGCAGSLLAIGDRIAATDTREEAVRLDLSKERDALERGSEDAFGPTELGGGLIFNGRGDHLVGKDVDLPSGPFHVTAWVSIETPLRWGGIVGRIEDNGGYEKGWVLGYDEERFTIGLASRGADDGDGKMTYLRGLTPYERGRWYHVAANYDGTTLALFVNGSLDASTGEQSGDVLHATEGTFVVGAYSDRDEFYAHDGRIRSVEIVPGAASQTELQAAFRAQQALTTLEPWDDTVFGWLVAPFLTWPALDAMSIGFETTEPSTASVRYRRDDVGSWTEQTLEGEHSLHTVRLQGLEPNQKYFYQCVIASEEARIEGPVSSFRTAATPDRPFTFVVLSDSQSQGDVARRVADLAQEQRPNFLVHAGDLVSTGSAKSDWTRYFFVHLGPLLGTIPMMPVLGNHEQDAQHYYDYMSLPEPERWYAFRYGDAEFFMLDGNRSLADQSEQLVWLESALSASTATWRFAVLHQPPYTSDSDDYGNTLETSSTRGDLNVRNIVALLEEHDVDICFSGHVHDYERTFPIRDGRVVPYEEGGVIYITAAGAGGHLEDFDPTNTWFGHKKARRHHLVYVGIHGDRLELQAIDEEGRLFDVLNLDKRQGSTR